MSEAGHQRGFWSMVCWNGLSRDQQVHLISVGVLPFGWKPEGSCLNGAALSIETEADAAPGPRFYCWDCGLDYLKRVYDGTDELP